MPSHRSHLRSKRRLLESAGFDFKGDRGTFVNLDLKKAFCLEFVQTHSAHDLEMSVREIHENWTYYCDEPVVAGPRPPLQTDETREARAFLLGE